MPEINGCHFAIADRSLRAIELQQAMDFVSHDDFGGYDIFIGRVRQNNQGRQVTGISYDIFAPLALQHFQELVTQIQSSIAPEMRIFLEHAHGRLAVGDIAVVVAVGTPHRDECFRACRQLIEAVKHRSPIWKQEHYVDGSSEWSEGCSLCEADNHRHDESVHASPEHAHHGTHHHESATR